MHSETHTDETMGLMRYDRNYWVEEAELSYKKMKDVSMNIN